MHLYPVLLLSALSISPQCHSQHVAPTTGNDTDFTALMRMMERLDEKIERLEHQNDRLAQQNDRLKQKIEHMEEMLESESFMLIKQENFTKISNLTRDSSDQIPEQQCLEKEDFGDLFRQLGDEIVQMKNISLQHLQSILENIEILKHVIIPSGCAGHMARGATTSGLYDFQANGQSIEVYCDMKTDGGGWLVFQRRKNGVVDFDRTWAEYEDGFGDPEEDFWLGNKLLHNITSSGKYDLRIDLKDKHGSTGFAQYESFWLGSPEQKYTLNFGVFSGNVKDCLRAFGRGSSENQRGMKFTTKDADHDKAPGNCANNYGAWWSSACGDAHLNGDWGRLDWYCWKSQSNSIIFSEMKIRPV